MEDIHTEIAVDTLFLGVRMLLIKSRPVFELAPKLCKTSPSC